MQYKSIKILINPLIKSGKEWQYIDLNGKETPPKLYFSNIQICIIVISLFLTIKLKVGLSEALMGYIISAFAVSVTLFMSLLVNIFDKFEKTVFDTTNKNEEEIVRLVQKKNFFKKFISITSYLVVMSILIITLCSMTYICFSTGFLISTDDLCLTPSKINWMLTFKSSIVFIYRFSLFYFLMDYLMLTLFVAGSSYEYYVSELNKIKILKK